MSVKEDLLKAAEIMKERGLGRCRMINLKGECCALGAIGLATFPNFEEYYWSIDHASNAQPYAELMEHPDSSAAISALGNAIKGKETYDPDIDVYEFSDRAVSGGQVIAMMIKAANSAGDE